MVHHSQSLPRSVESTCIAEGVTPSNIALSPYNCPELFCGGLLNWAVEEGGVTSVLFTGVTNPVFGKLVEDDEVLVSSFTTVEERFLETELRRDNVGELDPLPAFRFFALLFFRAE